MNKIILNSGVLLTALQSVAKTFERHVAVPIIECFLFEVSKGILTVSATDLLTTFKLSFQIECNKGLQFMAVVPPVITKFLSKLDEQPITLNWDAEKFSLEVLTEDGKAKYSGENAQDFPKHPAIESPLFETDSDLFKELKDLLNYSSNDEMRPALTGIGFVSHCGKFNISATDGHRLKVVNVPALNVDGVEFEIEQHFILRNKVAKILSDLKFGKDVHTVKVNADKSKVNISFAFQYGVYQAELITRNIDEKFPQYWSVIPDQAQTKTRLTVEKKTFLKVLDKAELFANKTTKQIRICLNGENNIKAEDLDFGNEYSGAIGGSYKGEEMEIGFNAEFLRDTVKSFGDTFTLELIAPNKAGVIRDERSTVLCMPVMLTQYEAPSAEKLASDLRQAREESKNI